MYQSFILLAALGLEAAAAAQLVTQCSFVGFSDSDTSRPMAYTAKCSRTLGGTADVCSQLDLSHCLSNQNGELASSSDDMAVSFRVTCAQCHVGVDGWQLFCQCYRMDQTLNEASIELNGVIDVQDGLLACSAAQGWRISECPVSRIDAPPRRRRRRG